MNLSCFLSGLIVGVVLTTFKKELIEKASKAIESHK